MRKFIGIAMILAVITVSMWACLDEVIVIGVLLGIVAVMVGCYLILE